MFTGVSIINLDAKGRIAIPSKYRDELQSCCNGRLVLTIHPDRCLLLYPFPEWEKVQHSLLERSNLDPQVRKLQRLVMGYAEDMEMNSQGRILITGPLRRFAGLDKQIAFVGQGTKFELWDAAAWDRQTEEFLADENNFAFSEAIEGLSL